MELKYNLDYDYDDLCVFSKVHHESQDLCLVCLTDETDTGQLLTRYELACGHNFHSRCIRKWCSLKNCVHCTCCGEVPETVGNMFCSECQEFGHNCELDA